MNQEPIKVFFSYSHRDEEFKDELVNHLSILRRQGTIADWHDRMIPPGTDWNREIDTYLNSADLILLMVSPDFIASDYCWGVEVQTAMQRHQAGDARVIPVILRRVDWEGAPFAKLQALPKNALPISSWSNRDDGFYNVVGGIKVAVENLKKAKQQKQQATVHQQPQAEQQSRLHQPSVEVSQPLQEKKTTPQQSPSAQVSSSNEALDRSLKQMEERAKQEAANRPPRKFKPLPLLLAGGALVGVIIAVMPKSQSPAPSPLPTSSADQLTAEGYLSRALEKFDQGKTEEAMADFKLANAAYEQAIKLNPNDVYTYLGRGRARAYLKDSKGAIADFDQVIKLKPDFSLAYNGRGFALYNSGDSQGAIREYDQAIKINRNWGDLGLYIAYHNRGNARFDLGDKQGAIADFDQAIKLKSDFSAAYFMRGNVRYALGDKQSAIADYDEAIKLKPDSASAYHNRGLARSDLGNHQGALEDYNQALKLNPRDADAYHNRGVAKENLDDKQGAIADYDQAISLRPDSANSYYGRGVVYKKQGNRQNAIADFQKARDLYQQQGNTEWYGNAVKQLKELQG
mgnify:CR=1 FL=1